MRRTERLLAIALPALLLLLLAAGAAGIWRAQQTLSGAAEIAKTRQRVGFQMKPWNPSAEQVMNPGFEPVDEHEGFTSGTIFHGNLYLAGPAGLNIYAADGKLLRTLRTGMELPVAPIVAVTTGRLRGATDAELLLATAGAGVLLLDPASSGAPVLRQLIPDAPEARDVTALLPLASGDLLLGTRHHGVLLFDGVTLATYRVNGDARDAQLEVTALAAPDSASLLVGTRNAGVYFLHAGTLQHADAASGLPDDQVESITTHDGNAFVGTPLGVAQFDLAQAGTADWRPSRLLAEGVFSHALAVPPGGQLLVGTMDQGVQQIDLATRPRLRNASLPIHAESTQALSSDRIDQFIAAPGSPLYALSNGALVSRTSTGWQPAPLPAATGLADRNISALAFAPDGTLYVGFFDHGLDTVSAATGAVRHLEDDHLFCVNRLALDPQRQTIAAATANGLVLFDRQGTPRQVLTRRDGLISDYITDVAFTRSGMTLATPAGLTFVGPAATESLYAFQGLVNNHVYALGTRADTDQLLAGTLGGLSLLAGGTVQRNFTASTSGLKHNWITALAPNPQGGWLVGTYGAGIMALAFDRNGAATFTPIELPAGAPHDLVINPNALLVTHGHVYAGTLGHGLLRFDAAASQWTQITRGLPSLNVTAFAQRDGQLYVGTENGLVRIAETKLSGGSSR